MKSKKLKIFSCILVLGITTSCKKYENGPLVSLRTKMNRIEGTFDIVLMKENEKNITKEYLISPVSLGSLKIEHDNISRKNPQWMISAISSYPEYHIVSSFMEFDEKYKIARTEGSSQYKPIFDSTWEITRLTDSEFWFKTQFNGNSYEVHMLKLKFL
jgi:hypothetical protein